MDVGQQWKMHQVSWWWMPVIGCDVFFVSKQTEKIKQTTALLSQHKSHISNCEEKKIFCRLGSADAWRLILRRRPEFTPKQPLSTCFYFAININPERHFNWMRLPNEEWQKHAHTAIPDMTTCMSNHWRWWWCQWPMTNGMWALTVSMSRIMNKFHKNDVATITLMPTVFYGYNGRNFRCYNTHHWRFILHHCDIVNEWMVFMHGEHQIYYGSMNKICPPKSEKSLMLLIYVKCHLIMMKWFQKQFHLCSRRAFAPIFRFEIAFIVRGMVSCVMVFLINEIEEPNVVNSECVFTHYSEFWGKIANFARDWMMKSTFVFAKIHKRLDLSSLKTMQTIS